MTPLSLSRKALLSGVAASSLLAVAAPDDMTIDAATRAEVIGNTSKFIGADYIYPELAEKMAADLRARQQRGEYDKLGSAKAFANKLTDDLRAVSQDKHLRVRFRTEPIAQDQVTATESAEELARYAVEAKANNFGFRQVKLLDGNVGYLRLDAFDEPALAGPTATAAITFLANTDALIIDLRNNGGGSPEMVQLLTSYLLGTTPVHLNDLYYRPQNATTQYWSHAYVPGPRLTNTPVFVLTAKRTFSAAEEFSYNLQSLKRATLVGETTGGGAHPGDMYRVHSHFQVFVANGKAINPITKTNWEGKGVVPEVPVAAADALLSAHKLALEGIISRSRDDAGREAAKSALASLTGGAK
ncbi:S41 family peptidase [Chitinimonas arctica]|uniref:S41 family peptidase n=1 Tax=Chitinimonas arctica TaxID=2594795 RepID=A0A516SDD1_9NEIS|nr:S41 family peptidase [Chitinimonas arctica]QDQ26167.1 S41 family peptidase [Chitinimonas arctica]